MKESPSFKMKKIKQFPLKRAHISARERWFLAALVKPMHRKDNTTELKSIMYILWLYHL
jgi:hypothetical protein